MLFTTSWDDGYGLDLTVAALLKKNGLTGTFYVCPTHQHDRTMLTENQIRTLSGDFEIGAHTLTHRKLSTLMAGEAEQEIKGSKAWVEQVTGKPCDMFCYPKGDCGIAAQTFVKQAGYRGARTTEQWRCEFSNPFAMPVSLQIMPFPLRRSFRPIWKILDPLGPLRANWRGLGKNNIPLSARTSWLAMARAFFRNALKRNAPFFHLYGHSHEIERYGLWHDLAEFLEEAGHSGVTPVTNGSLASKHA
ncbi:MAG: polysaccharide deacetylase family protein [Candidatus Peribacteraceae bacterium]|nr:polysaccharide deacetylase family protein [Candidatus Peribacteraceae bacterium]MDD5074787.1 polysaccharide deacetylase family protein [Candidatus Peribacteraceae bacterium]